jgi:hypothetical protein
MPERKMPLSWGDGREKDHSPSKGTIGSEEAGQVGADGWEKAGRDLGDGPGNRKDRV